MCWPSTRPPGRWWRGYKLPLSCQGSGSPTVVLEAIAGEKPAPLRPLGNLKRVVLSHGYTDPAGQPGVPPEVIREYEGVWAQLPSELAVLSSNSKRVVAEKSGHHIQLKQPELVVQAIRDGSLGFFMWTGPHPAGRQGLD